MPEGAKESARVQLCGTFVVELSGRRIDNMLPGRQGRLLFAYLVLSRLRPVSRSTLIEALWGDDQPANTGGALNALISKTRAVIGGGVLRGRSELILALPEPAYVAEHLRPPARLTDPKVSPTLRQRRHNHAGAC